MNNKRVYISENAGCQTPNLTYPEQLSMNAQYDPAMGRFCHVTRSSHGRSVSLPLKVQAAFTRMGDTTIAGIYQSAAAV